MGTEEKIQQRLRTNRRHRNRKRRVKRVRTRSEQLAEQIVRTPVQVAVLSHAVNQADIVNLRKHNDESLGVSIRDEGGKFRTGHRKPRLMEKERAKKKFTMRALKTALANVEKEIDKVPIFEHFVRRAYENDQVLKALMNKILPDLKTVDAKIVQKSPYKLIIDVSPRLLEARKNEF